MLSNKIREYLNEYISQEVYVQVAVAKGKNIGIFLSFNDCNKAIKGYKHPLIKKCNTLQECERFIIENRNAKGVLQEEYVPYDVKYNDGTQENIIVEKTSQVLPGTWPIFQSELLLQVNFEYSPFLPVPALRGREG